jgi:ABC-type branched-subunit amino acid transport system substrate-binding protein
MLRKVGALGVTGAALAVLVAMTLSGTASARIAAAAGTTVSCTKAVAIGVAYPQNGPVATLGATQWNWAVNAEKIWNKSQSPKIKLIRGDTDLDGTNPQDLQVAHAFASNNSIVAVTGPAGSQEMIDTASIWKSAGLAPISGSETKIELTRAQPGNNPRLTTPGYFFRTVPNDGQQGDNVAAYIHKVLKKTKVLIIDDGEAYSTGLAGQVGTDLKADNVTVNTNSVTTSTTDFSSVIDAIPPGTQLIYIPWQNATEAQQFYVQLHQHGGTEILMGSDGTDVPGTFKGKGSYVSGFPVDFTSKIVSAFAKAHKGDPETFGIPTYTSVLVNATAIQKECKAHGNKITRSEVRTEIPKVKLTKTQSLLGFPVSFLKGNLGKYQGPGDMGGTASFGIYQIQANGSYKRVG